MPPSCAAMETVYCAAADADCTCKCRQSISACPLEVNEMLESSPSDTLEFETSAVGGFHRGVLNTNVTLNFQKKTNLTWKSFKLVTLSVTLSSMEKEWIKVILISKKGNFKGPI